MIKAIVFDCFGVLTQNHWTHFVESLSPSLQTQVLDIHRAYERGFIEFSDFKNQLLELGVIDIEKIYEFFIKLENYRKNEELLKLISELNDRYKLAILSNAGSSWVVDEMLTSQEAEMFDAVVLSYQVGFVKPDPQIYKIVLDRLQVEPQHSIFIDDLESNCIAADGLGMKTILFKNVTQFKQQLNEILSDTKSLADTN